ncbi:Cytochrome c family protein [Roseibacterium elongatum DSM 19469]|uniref:Cytochrome c family protein n=1 Tax=Roseicyclus elongatus DSM 19469 TaxID=1294273 RepID=W8RTV4_9RHOB|nr:hypothetical protein [Roseibacterium elongatum]AHM04649.1 Cytochrome c family protein [Roseibacterium elongatum DSM 19469]
MRYGIGLGGVALALALAGCMEAEEPPTGAEDFVALCATCHGGAGAGDGPAAIGVTPRPADLTLLAARNGGTFPMLEVMARIDGYTSDTGTMPEFGLLFEGELVPFETEPGVMTPTPPRLIALAEYIGTLQR